MRPAWTRVRFCVILPLVFPYFFSEGIREYMNKKYFLPLLAVLGGGCAFLLRLWQNRTGFEADTGLPIPGAPAGAALAGF